MLHFISEERLEQLVSAERRSAFLAGLRQGEKNMVAMFKERWEMKMGRKGPYFVPPGWDGKAESLKRAFNKLTLGETKDEDE